MVGVDFVTKRKQAISESASHTTCSLKVHEREAYFILKKSEEKQAFYKR